MKGRMDRMAKQRSKSPTITEEEYLRNQIREESYRYTIETEKRHELLFASYGINFSYYRTLVYLLFHPDGAAPSQIADDLLILRQSMTSIIDFFEKRALVERVSDSKDRRRIQVRLLPEGQALGETLLKIEDAYGERLKEYISAEEIDTFHQLEKKMYEAKVSALNDIIAEREKAEGGKQ